MEFLPADWSQVFYAETALLELFARGTALYFGILILILILILLRLMPRRTGGGLATMDLIFIVLIANAAAHSMGDYTSVADGLVLSVTLVSWNYVINVLSYRIRAIEWLVSAPPLQIVRDGKILWRNMRRELVTKEELMGHLRELGIDDVADVKAAYVEGEGKISAVRYDK